MTQQTRQRNGAPVKRVLVVGAGIGGLSLAGALQRSGIEVAVFERAVGVHPAGAGITVQINAVRALRAFDLADAVVGAGTSLRTTEILDKNGRVLSAMDLSGAEARFGAPVVALHRARLHEALLSQLTPGTVRFGSAVKGCRDDGDSVVLELEDGREERGDLLVDAGGLHSPIRAAVAGPSGIRYSGYTSWRGICRDDGFTRDAHATESWGPGARFGIVPIGFGEVYWFSTLNAPPDEKDAPEEVRARLLRIFGDWHRPVADILEATPAEQILRTDIADRVPVKRWVRGRIVLLGDAAHPMTPNLGQGACQAIEDAAVLALLLRSTPDLDGALAEYERRRVPRANALVEQSWRMGRIAQLENPVAIALRNLAFRLVPRRAAESAAFRIFDFDVE